MLVIGNSNGMNVANSGGLGGGTTGPTNYVGLGLAPSNSISEVAFPLPIGGTLGNLQVRLNGSPNNGSGTQTYTFTLVRNAAPIAAIECSISENANSCSSTGTTNVDAGTQIALRSVPSRSSGGASWPTAREVIWSFSVTP
jgi:hypothetical protein